MNKNTRSFISKQDDKFNKSGGELIFSPTSTISVNLPVIDPIFGTPAYIQGPPINLTPNNNYNKIVDMVPFRTASLRLSAIPDVYSELSPKSRCSKDNNYKNLSNTDINNVINELQSSTSRSTNSTPCRMPSCPPGSQPSTNPYSVDGWSLTQVGGNKRYLLISNKGGITKCYSGAGIMVIERLYKNSLGREEPAVILFRSCLTGEYEELGGGVDIKDFAGENTLSKTAKREAKEESSNLFNFDNVDLDMIYKGLNNNVDRNANGDIYRCYIVCLAENQGNNRWKDMYDYNRTIIDRSLAKSYWKETNDMQRFFISDLVNNIGQVRGSVTVTDAEGYTRIVAGRTKGCLKMMLKGYMFTGASTVDMILSSARSITNVRNDMIDDSSYLVGTVSVVVN